MYTADDVVPGSTWMVSGRGFTISAVTNGFALYVYSDGMSGMAPTKTIVRTALRTTGDAKPATPPKCLPECGPAKPCMQRLCPGRRPEYTGCGSFDEWSRAQMKGGWWRVVAAVEYAQPDLRCDRELACGLYRLP